MKNFAIIIKFEENNAFRPKQKTRTLASSRFEAVCVMYYDAKTHSHLQQKKEEKTK